MILLHGVRGHSHSHSKRSAVKNLSVLSRGAENEMLRCHENGPAQGQRGRQDLASGRKKL